MKCEICEVEDAIVRCRLCGRFVCKHDVSYDGVCLVCKATLCEICGVRHAIGHCVLCGRLICRSDGIRDNLHRICVYCARQFKGISTQDNDERGKAK